MSTYEERHYRKEFFASDLVNFTVIEQESDLLVMACENLEHIARAHLLHFRTEISEYAQVHPEFLTSLRPLPSLLNKSSHPQMTLLPLTDVMKDHLTFLESSTPPIVQGMLQASQLGKVGPMAAVAGAISEYVGTALLAYTPEVLVENGGDIFMKILKPRTIAIYAGTSPFSNKIGLRIQPEETPLGICTSAGTVGHSLSFGKADAVVVRSKDTLLADAVATAIGNRIKSADNIPQGIAFAKRTPGIEGVLIIIGDQLGIWGNMTLVKL